MGSTQAHTGDAPSDTPTAISQVFPKWPLGWPSFPLKALRWSQPQKGEKERERLTQRRRGRRRRRGRGRGRERRRTWRGGMRGTDRLDPHFSTTDERNLGVSPGQASLDFQPVHQEHRCQDFPRAPHLLTMSPAQFLKHGKKVICPLPRTHTLTSTADRRYRQKLPRTRKGTRKPRSERTLLLPQAHLILPAVPSTRGKATDPPRCLGPPRRFFSRSLSPLFIVKHPQSNLAW